MTGLDLAELKKKADNEMDFEYLAAMEDDEDFELEEELLEIDEDIKPEAEDSKDLPKHKKIFNQEFRANDILQMYLRDSEEKQ